MDFTHVMEFYLTMSHQEEAKLLSLGKLQEDYLKSS